MKKSVFLKSVSIVLLGSVIMANKKCDKTPEPRQLKKNIKVVGMSASTFLDSSGFSFSETAQNQLSGVFFESNEFFERNTYPSYKDTDNLPEVKTSDFQKASMVADVNAKANEQLQSWFPDIETAENFSRKAQLSQESSCMISRPQHLLLGKINALEAFNGGGLQFGFNGATASLPFSAGLNFKIDKMRMDLSMHAFDPWTQEQMGSVNSEVFKKDYKIGFNVTIYGVSIGPEFYRATGMAETVLKGLKKTVKDMYNKLADLPRQDWQTRVLLSRDNYVVIVGGAELGIKKGDRFQIVNEVHDWMGEPCGESSTLMGSATVTATPWIVEIEDAGNLMSKAKVINIDENTSINVGALVTVDKLVEDPVPDKK